MKGLELASKVSTKEPYYFGNENAAYKIAALDIGYQEKYFAQPFESRCHTLKCSHTTHTFEEMSAWNPDGYFLSNGPGDPQPLNEAQEVAKEIIDQRTYPCLASAWDIKSLLLPTVFQHTKCTTGTVESIILLKTWKQGRVKLLPKIMALQLVEKKPNRIQMLKSLMFI
jgi:hypothetical protein